MNEEQSMDGYTHKKKINICFDEQSTHNNINNVSDTSPQIRLYFISYSTIQQ